MIVVEQLFKSYDGQPVLENLNLCIQDGEVLGIVGRSGTGKTTFFRILMGLTKADHGTIEGLEKRRISSVFQENRLCENMSAIENLFMVCEGKSRIQLQTALSKILPFDSLTQPVHVLSGGMKRRVAIARAMLAPSNIILMDEPFQGLDQGNKDNVIQFIKEFREQRTLCIITHQREEMEAFIHSRIFDILGHQC